VLVVRKNLDGSELGNHCCWHISDQAPRFANESGIGAFLSFGGAGDVVGMACFDPKPSSAPSACRCGGEDLRSSSWRNSMPQSSVCASLRLRSDAIAVDFQDIFGIRRPCSWDDTGYLQLVNASSGRSELYPNYHSALLILLAFFNFYASNKNTYSLLIHNYPLPIR
jgi:hypothetical protein